MENREKPIIDMTREGEFVDHPRGPPHGDARFGPSPFGMGKAPLAARIGRTAIIVAVLSGLLLAAVLALSFALVLIPVVIIASTVAWAAYRFQLWRLRR